MILLFNGISSLSRYMYVSRKLIKKAEDANGFPEIGLGMILLFTPYITISLFGILCGIYLFVIALVNLINYILLRGNKVSGRIIFLIQSIIYGLFGLSLIFAPKNYVGLIINIVAFYFFVFGVRSLFKAIRLILPTKVKDSYKRKIHITLPAVFEALIPRIVLSEVNEFLKPSEMSHDQSEPKFIQKTSDKEVNLEIFVHISEKGFGSIGHVDLYFDGKIISYGNYDEDSLRLFDSIGDGVLFTAERYAYIPFVIQESDKTLFGFGLHLSEGQVIQVRRKIDEIFTDLVAWEPVIHKKRSVYAQRLQENVNTNFYKFKSGKFKTYFVVGSNCVMLADQIVGSAGTDILKINGIIAPGTYFDYLNKSYQKGDGLVVSKEIYN